MELNKVAEIFVDWLDRRIEEAGRGDAYSELDVDPAGRFWLGRLAPEDEVATLGLGERGERLTPCATGLVLRPSSPPPWRLIAHVSAKTWLRNVDDTGWVKSPSIEVDVPIMIESVGEFEFGTEEIGEALAFVCGMPGMACTVSVEVSSIDDDGFEMAIQMVNTSPATSRDFKDTNLYECALEVSGIDTTDFVLEALPDSFRYDRRVPAYGINGGVERTTEGSFRTTDVIRVDRNRPVYWSVSSPPPDLTFSTLARDPFLSLRALAEGYSAWGFAVWGEDSLDARANRDSWTDDMRAQARHVRAEFLEESERIRSGIALLEVNDQLLRAFRLMNEAMSHAANGRYPGWRPFQIGFLLANLAAIARPREEAETVDIVWFATGGGKTETYLGLIVTAALYDRLTGKKAGITAWSRFPLRMLSLQQTQRFADAIAGAEIARMRAGIAGDPLSIGFFVGSGAIPNKISQDPKPGQPDPTDESMPGQFQVLAKCPFCHSENISMAFDRRYWKLEHRCDNCSCPWDKPGLPFYVVDDEIYRFLPTVIVGTLDKAASIALQAAMRGFVGAPLGVCSGPDHGFVYAPRSNRPNGCLVAGCRFETRPLDMPAEAFGPSFRLQDELHLLRDSLGAVDAHYESLLDYLEERLSGRKPKILASSATLTGYKKQCDVLYRRSARVFPAQGPSRAEGFWSSDSDALMRRFVAVAPRGVTLEYATDKTVTELQRAVRRLASEPELVCNEAGVPVEHAADLLSLFGVDVVYGNTLRDLDAAVRSLETQILVDGNLNTATLSGRTPFEEVRGILERLNTPEPDFEDRLHVIGASSMMSHGVDVDRLNVMVMLGLPLTTAEFIQTTARVGRRWPGIVFVMHKIARERDASVYRSFDKFIEQGDRFVEPIPITRRSRRVLQCTIPGIVQSRRLVLHEANSDKPLTTIPNLREYCEAKGVTAQTEYDAIAETLGLNEAFDAGSREDLRAWLEVFFRNLASPAGDMRFPNELGPGRSGPMTSLRDVEEQIPIYGTMPS